MVRVFVIQRVVCDAGDVDGRAKCRRHFSHGQQREKAAVAQAPDADAVAVHVWEGLEVVGAESGVLEVIAANVHVDALAPGRSVPDAAAIVGRQHDVALLCEVLMEAVVDGVVALDVPAVVVLIHTVAVNPDDGGVFLGSVKKFRHKQIRRDLLAVGARVLHQFRFHKRGAIQPGRKRTGESDGLRSWRRVGHPQVR